MKSLDQVEPRTVISSLPFTIATPGSYYFAGNLQFTAASGDAITISASDVTVDLMGFALSSSAAVTGSAIHITSGSGRVAVCNGAVAGNTTVTVSGSAPNQTWKVTAGGFSAGILAEGASVFDFSRLRISGCRSSGIETALGSAMVTDVSVTQNGSNGILIGSNFGSGVVSHCVAFQNGGPGITNLGGTVASCTALQNSSTGITCSTGSTLNSVAVFNGFEGLNSIAGSISNCVAYGNASNGINGSSTTVMNSTAYANGSNGIAIGFGVVAFSTATQNDLKNNGSVDISAGSSTRTGNNPTP